MSGRNEKGARWTMVIMLSLLLGAGGRAGGQETDPGAPDAPKEHQPRTAGPVRGGAAAFDLPGVGVELLAPFRAFRSEVKEDGRLRGYIDWSGKKIISVGRSMQSGRGGANAAAARRAAGLIALRNVLAASAGVRIGINGRIDAIRNGTIALQGIVKDFKVTRTYSQIKDGKVYWIAEVHVPMFGVGSVAGKFYDAQWKAHTVLVAGMKRAAWAAPAKPAATEGDLLVIDARGLGFSPSMYPLLVDPDNEILIGMKTVTRDVAVQRGLCAYATTDLKIEALQSLGGPAPSDRKLVDLAAAAGARGQNVDGIRWSTLLLAQAAEAADPLQARPDSSDQTATAPATSPATQPTTRPRRKPRRFVVRATRTQGGEKAILVIDKQESLKLLKDPRAAGLARDGRVLVVVDAAAAGMEGRLPPGPPRPGEGVQIAVQGE